MRYVKQAFEIIKASDTWDQKQWGENTPCGFKGCLIGHMIKLKWKAATFKDNKVYVQGKRRGYAWDVGRELSGLSQEDFDRLSDSHNTLDDIERIINEIS